MSDAVAAEAAIPPAPVLDADTLKRLVPGGMLRNPISPDLSGIARADDFKMASAPPLMPQMPRIPLGQQAVPSTDTVVRPFGMDSSAGGQATGDPNAIRQQTVQFWQSQGVPAHVAEGIADALAPESGFRPWVQVVDTNGMPSGGLYQHNGPRLEKLKQFAQQQGKPWTDPMVQHQFANQERQGGDPTTAAHWNEIANAPDRATAKALWQKYFERGVLQGGAGGMGGMGVNPQQDELQRSAEAVRNGLISNSTQLNERARSVFEKVDNLEKDIPASLQRIQEARQLSDQSMKSSMEAMNRQPAPPHIDGIQKLGGLATIVGILGGMLTKAPMIASLNAASSAIEAAKQGDIEGYELNFNSWKTNNDMLFKIADMQSKRANDIANDEKMSLSERRGALDVYLRAVGLTQLADKARVEGDQVIYDYNSKMFDAVEKRHEHEQKVQLAHERFMQSINKPGKNDVAMEHYNKWRQENPNASEEEDSEAYSYFQKAFPSEKAREFDKKESRLSDKETTRREEAEAKMRLARDKTEAQISHMGNQDQAASVRQDLARQRIAWEKAKNPAAGQYLEDIEKYREENGGAEPPVDWKEEKWMASNKSLPLQKDMTKGSKSPSHNYQVVFSDGRPDPNLSGEMYMDTEGKPHWVGTGEPVDVPEGGHLARTKGTGAQEPAITLTDEAVENAARRWIAGDHSSVTGLGYGTVGSNNRAKIYNKIAEIGKAENISSDKMVGMLMAFRGRGAEISALGRAQQVIERSVVEAQTLAPQVLITSNKVNRGRYTDLNTILLSGERRTGDPNVVNFGIALNSFINAYARALAPTGTATVSDKEHARELLATNWSKGQIQSAMRQLNLEMRAARNATDEVWEDIISRVGTEHARGPEIINRFNAKADPSLYNEPQDVYAIYENGMLTKEQATKILKEKFGAVEK